MQHSVRRIVATATLALATVAVTAGAASATTINLPAQKGDCVFIGSVTVGNPLYSRDLVKSDPKTGVYTNNNCPA